MYSHLSDNQKKICNYNEGTVVIKACPGSGKTYSVTARISRLMANEIFLKKGIAALSFTNIACDEIKHKLKVDFGHKSSIGHPHFIGTIDSFINQYIFLPFGHLLMKCQKRPELVGEPHSTWSAKKYSTDYDQYFDKTSFSLNGDLIRLAPYQAFHFKWQLTNLDGSLNKNIQNIIKSKGRLFKKGFANQSDANFISLKILERYPLIAENIANQFKYFIIDEAQDTDEIQMRVIEILNEKGSKNIMLIGDRDQAIFEWNNAKPELFDAKYNQWEKIELNENRRSSQKICNITCKLSSFERSYAINTEICSYDYIPELLGYKWPKKKPKTEEFLISPQDSKITFDKIMLSFCATCEQHNIAINKQNVAVLYRGKDYARYLGLKSNLTDYDNIPWLDKHFHVRDIIRGKILYEKGEFKRGFALLEKGYIEALNKQNNDNFYCNKEFIQDLINQMGYKNYSSYIHKFIESLPKTENSTILTWTNTANQVLSNHDPVIELKINNDNSDIPIKDYFGGDIDAGTHLPFYHGTIHSIKGKTFEAVLVLIGKKPGSKSNYVTMLKNGCKDGEEEELRNIYVAITRPRRILMIAVPEEDLSEWKKKLY